MHVPDDTLRVKNQSGYGTEATAKSKFFGTNIPAIITCLLKGQLTALKEIKFVHNHKWLIVFIIA